MAPKSITHLLEEEIIRVLRDSARVVTEVNSLSDYRYRENFANSSAETRIVLVDDSLLATTTLTIFLIKDSHDREYQSFTK